MSASSRLLDRARYRWVLAGAVIVSIALAVVLAVFLLYPKDATAAMDRGYYAAARSYYLGAAKKGDARAQNALGNLYYLGLGGDQNYKTAANWYLKSAAQAHAPAQINLARLFRDGLGVRRDVLRGFAWLRQARINGSKIAENQMRWTVGSLSLSPNQIQRAQELYRNLADLVPQPERW